MPRRGRFLFFQAAAMTGFIRSSGLAAQNPPASAGSSLVEKGIPRESAETVFEPVDEIEELARLKKELISGEKLLNPEEKVLNLGVIMLRKQVLRHFGLTADPFQPLEKPFQSR